MVLVLTGCVTGQKQQKQTKQISDYERSSRTYYEATPTQKEARPPTKHLEPSVQPSEKKYDKPIQLNARQIQKALKNTGCYQGPIDGIIGAKTKSAIVRFQNAHGLKPDGIVGKKTSAELNKYLDK